MIDMLKLLQNNNEPNYIEKQEFIHTLSNHKFLKFDPSHEKIVHYKGIMKDFLSFHFSNDILCKLGLFPTYFNNKNNLLNIKKGGIYTPCFILHPAAFEFMVGNKSLAVTIHNIKQEIRNDFAKILGVSTDILDKTSFTLVKSDINKKYNNIVLIHEATHIIQNKSTKPTLIDEIDAFINEIITFKFVVKNDFNKYIKTKNMPNNKIDKNIFKMTKLIWDISNQKNFWNISKQDKINWIKYFINHKPI